MALEIVCKKCGGEIEFFIDEEFNDDFEDDTKIFMLRARCKKCYKVVDVGKITFEPNLHLHEEEA